jgi:hypothetical protein
LPAQVSAGLGSNHFYPAEFEDLILEALLRGINSTMVAAPA